MRRLRMIPWVLASFALAAGCGDDECTPSDDHCEGSVAWVCNGGGDKGPLAWEQWPCGAEGLACRDGACFAEPLVRCDTPDEWTCDGARRLVGRCSEKGWWGWDTSHPCEPDAGERCASGAVVRDGRIRTLARCVIDPAENCAVGEPDACREGVAIGCSDIGLRAILEDCASRGTSCVAGRCLAVAR